MRIQVSQGSAATDLRWGGRFNTTFLSSRPRSENTTVKELLKSVYICQNYCKNKSGTFLRHGQTPCIMDNVRRAVSIRRWQSICSVSDRSLWFSAKKKIALIGHYSVATINERHTPPWARSAEYCWVVTPSECRATSGCRYSKVSHSRLHL